MSLLVFAGVRRIMRKTLKEEVETESQTGRTRKIGIGDATGRRTRIEGAAAEEIKIETGRKREIEIRIAEIARGLAMMTKTGREGTPRSPGEAGLETNPDAGNPPETGDPVGGLHPDTDAGTLLSPSLPSPIIALNLVLKLNKIHESPVSPLCCRYHALRCIGFAPYITPYQSCLQYEMQNKGFPALTGLVSMLGLTYCKTWIRDRREAHSWSKTHCLGKKVVHLFLYGLLQSADHSSSSRSRSRGRHQSPSRDRPRRRSYSRSVPRQIYLSDCKFERKVMRIHASYSVGLQGIKRSCRRLKQRCNLAASYLEGLSLQLFGCKHADLADSSVVSCLTSKFGL